MAKLDRRAFNRGVRDALTLAALRRFLAELLRRVQEKFSPK